MHLWQDPCPTPPLLDLRNNLLGHICSTAKLFFFSIPCTRIPFYSNILSRLFCFLSFFDIDVLMDRPCEMASHCGYDCISLVVSDIEQIFMFIDHWYIFFKEVLCSLLN